MKSVIGLLVFVAAAGPVVCKAEFGSIETRDRQRFEGEIFIRSGLFQVANTNTFVTNEIKMAQLSSVRIEPALSPSNAPIGVLLVNGSVLARDIESMDDTALRFSRSGKDPAISVVNIARIILQPTREEILQKLNPGRRGLLLRNNDFVDADLKSIQRREIRTQSVLFGSRTFSFGEVAAIILREPVISPCRFEIRTRDSSVLRVNEMRLANGELVLRGPPLAQWRVPANLLVELKRN